MEVVCLSGELRKEDRRGKYDVSSAVMAGR